VDLLITCVKIILIKLGMQPVFIVDFMSMSQSMFLCVTVSKPGKMWHGQSLMGGQRHIQHSTQNLLLQSVGRTVGVSLSKDHHCLPETLLPKIVGF